jgi:hypothetical protein
MCLWAQVAVDSCFHDPGLHCRTREGVLQGTSSPWGHLTALEDEERQGL